jgi:hypothetical protein
MGTEDLDVIADKLRSIVEELDDLITDRLHIAVSMTTKGGEPDPVVLAEEKLIARARRSVAKAATILRPPPSED